MHILGAARSALGGAVLIAAVGAQGAGTVLIEREFVPDLDSGKQVFEVCARCHLPEAWGDRDGTYPQLAGQHARVLIKQLLDIRSGKRNSPLMYPFVQERTIGGDQSLADVVAYISTLPMSPDHVRGPWGPGTPEHERGRALYTARCASCHGASGEGSNEARYPRLQGQHYSYMLRQAQLVKKGLREVDPSMIEITLALGDEEMREVVSYISYLEVPEKDRAPSKDWRNPDFR